MEAENRRHSNKAGGRTAYLMSAETKQTKKKKRRRRKRDMRRVQEQQGKRMVKGSHSFTVGAEGKEEYIKQSKSKLGTVG